MNNTEDAIDFLRKFAPGGPWVLCAIVPDGKITADTFDETRVGLLRDWINVRQGSENVYFHVNKTKGNMKRKALKDHIAEVSWLHVDLDPTTTEPDLFEPERQRILKKLRSFVPPPTCIIDSGGGYQGFWRLSEPFTGDKVLDAEGYNQKIEMLLGGDHCFNIDRIMRLPGTINVPNAKKLKKGRQPAPTVLVELTDRVYDISSFSSAPTLDGGSGDVGRAVVKLSSNIPTLAGPDDLDNIEGITDPLPMHYKMLIVQGLDPENPDKNNSRSETYWSVVCEMVRRKYPPDIIAAVSLDPDFGISGHPLDQPKPQDYVVRQIQRAMEFAEAPELSEVNDEYFVSTMGGQTFVFREDYDEALDRHVLQKMSFGAFKDLYRNQYVETGQDKSGKPIMKDRGSWWIANTSRRTYANGITFLPGRESRQGTYNLWQGYNVQAIEGRGHQRFLDHVYQNICGGSEEIYDYLIRWAARVVQTPATASETAVVMRSGQGTGKGLFARTLGRLFGRHFLSVRDSKHLVGNFNAHLQDVVLLFADEAFYAGDKRHEGIIKALVTEDTITVEPKGVDVRLAPNFLHILIASNNDWVIPADVDDRRFLVLDVQEEHKQDAGYFGPMMESMHEGGYSNLLHDLMTMDISGFDVRKVPKTKALMDQKMMSMDPFHQWWFSKLEDGRVFPWRASWDDDVRKETLWDDYIESMKDMGVSRRLARVVFAKMLIKLFPENSVRTVQRIVEDPYTDEMGHQRTKTVRPYFYKFPSLTVCRAHFDKKYGGPHNWPEPPQDGLLKEEVQEETPF